MSEEKSGKGLGLGCVIALVIGLLLLLLVLVGAGVAGYLFWRNQLVTAEPPPPQPEVVITTDVAKRKPPEYDEKKERDIFRSPGAAARTVTVGLTGTGDGGTWYTVDGDIREGDVELSEVVTELVAEARKKGQPLIVKLEATEDAGITERALEAAGKVCEAAGARLAEPEAEKR